MRSRGPDVQTVSQRGAIALGHCLLRTSSTVPRTAHPLDSADGSLTITFDGRLDNRSELLRSLAQHGVFCVNDSDAALVLAAYQQYGEVTPERLLGDFAFVIHDRKRQCVFCVRDPIGARPLYYVHTSRYFGVASDDDALLAVPGIEAVADDQQLAWRVALPFWLCIEEFNWLRDVHVLLPGHTAMIELNSGNVVQRQYWRPPMQELAKYRDVGEALEAFRELFDTSVRDRLRGAGTPAALCSGGMDSASILATLRDLGAQAEVPGVHAYSVLYDGPEPCVETAKIRALAAATASAHFTVAVPSFAGTITRENFFATRWRHTHPVDSALPVLQLCLMMAQHNGQRVLLHGASGDCCSEVDMGYLRHHARSHSVLSTWREARLASRHHTYLKGKNATRLALSALIRGRVPNWVHAVAATLSNHRTRESSLLPDIAESLEQHLAVRERAQAARSRRVNLQRDNYLQERQDFMFPLEIVHGLESYERMSGRFGIEMRDPYSDRRIVEFFLRLPVEYLAHDGWTKFLVRTSFADRLPTSVVWSSDKSHIASRMSHEILRHELAHASAMEPGMDEALGHFLSHPSLHAARRLSSSNQADHGTVDRMRQWQYSCEWLPTARWLLGLRTRRESAKCQNN